MHVKGYTQFMGTLIQLLWHNFNFMGCRKIILLWHRMNGLLLKEQLIKITNDNSNYRWFSTVFS